MRRLLSVPLLAAAFAVLVPQTASAQQTFNIFVGGFTPRAMDGRGTDDVLFRNAAFLSTLNRDVGIDIKEFNGAALGGEYLVALGRNFEGGLGIGWYQKTVPTVYTDFQNENRTEIFQDLKLRVVPFTATVRFLPLGTDAPVQPYIGAGVGVLSWRYSETGQFIGTDGLVFTDTFVGSGSQAGPVVLGGVRFPLGRIALGGELRWQNARADLPISENFAGSKIDLTGMSFGFTVGFKF